MYGYSFTIRVCGVTKYYSVLPRIQVSRWRGAPAGSHSPLRRKTRYEKRGVDSVWPHCNLFGQHWTVHAKIQVTLQSYRLPGSCPRPKSQTPQVALMRFLGIPHKKEYVIKYWIRMPAQPHLNTLWFYHVLPVLIILVLLVLLLGWWGGYWELAS
jgi:hypothetical protein